MCGIDLMAEQLSILGGMRRYISVFSGPGYLNSRVELGPSGGAT